MSRRGALARASLTVLIAVAGCVARLPEASAPSLEMADAKLLSYERVSTRPAPPRREMRDGAVAIVAARASGARTVVSIARFDPAAGNLDEMVDGFRESMRKRVTGTRLGTLHTKPVASEVEMGDDVDPVSPDTRFLLWTRTHRDVAVLVAAPSERVGSQVLAEYAIAWGRMR